MILELALFLGMVIDIYILKIGYKQQFLIHRHKTMKCERFFLNTIQLKIYNQYLDVHSARRRLSQIMQ